MADPQPPQLPVAAPVELREFVACRRATVTIRSGPLDWLPKPPELGDYAPVPEITLEPGATAGTGTITVGLGFVKFSLPVAIRDGRLEIDTSGLPDLLSAAREPIDTWVRDLNDFIAANRKRLKPATIRSGAVTLEKVPIGAPPAQPPGGDGPKPVPPPAPPATPPPVSGGSGCLLWILGLVLALGLGLGAAVATGIIPLGGQAPSPSGSATGPGPSGPSPSASAGPSASVEAPAPSPSISAAPVVPAPAGVEPAIDLLIDLGLIVDSDVDAIDWQIDPSGDWYFPQPGQTPVQHPPSIDLTGAAAFLIDLTAAQAASISEAMPCGEERTRSSDVPYRSACNQQGPLAAGETVVIITTHAGGFPEGLPPAALHSWSVFSDVDGNPATGFASGAPDNFLIGADVFHEVVAFVSNTGDFRYYVLATRPDDPPRADTGATQGNLAANERVAWFFDDDTFVWIINRADFGPNWYAGAFATTDRGANSPATLAADALRDPDSPEWRRYEEILRLTGFQR